LGNEAAKINGNIFYEKWNKASHCKLLIHEEKSTIGKREVVEGMWIGWAVDSLSQYGGGKGEKCMAPILLTEKFVKFQKFFFLFHKFINLI
jgi:hypothetical protein